MRYYTAAALGRVLGLSEAEIGEMVRRGAILKGVAENGLFMLEPAAREILDDVRRMGERDADYLAERARLMRVRRKQAEHELRLREKELHETQELEPILDRIFGSFRAKIRALPARLAPRCAKLTSQEDIFELLQQTTDEALMELSDLETVLGEEGPSGQEEERPDGTGRDDRGEPGGGAEGVHTG